MQRLWNYAHQDLGEPSFVDGSPILRPVVPLVVSTELPAVLGVLDSGSPVSVASTDVFRWLGVDLSVAQPLYEIPLSVGGGFDRIPVFRVRLLLRAPMPEDATTEWVLDLGARSRWRLPFAVLLGQRGWFNQFPTRIDAQMSSVEVPEALS
jgi:hypothetical protein